MNQPLATAVSALALPTWAAGRSDAALALAQEAVTMAERTRNTNTRAFAHTTVTVLHLLRRRPEPALECSAALGRLAEEDAAEYWRANAEWTRGAALVQLGRAEEGLRSLEDGLRRKQRTGSLQWETWMRLFQAFACLRLGNLAGCDAALERAFAAVDEKDHRFLEAELHRCAALAAALRPGGAALAEAEARLRRALAIARNQQARFWELRAACDLARLLTAEDRAREACDLVQPLLGAFEEGHDLPDLIEARALLAAPGALIAG